MKKLFAVSVLLLQIAIQPSYADPDGSITSSFTDPSVSISYKSFFVQDQGIGKSAAFNHGGNLGFYYPVGDMGEVGFEVDISRPEMLFLDQEKTNADMLTSGLVYSGVAKLQKRFSFLNDFAVIAGIGVGPAYITFDGPKGTTGAPYSKRELAPKLTLGLTADTSVSFPITDYLHGYIGYSFYFSQVGEVSFKDDARNANAQASGKANMPPLISHGAKAGIMVPVGQLWT